MKWRWIAAVVLACACGDDDDDPQNDSTSADDSSIPDGGPCGIAGGPLPTDELHTPNVGTDPDGRPAVMVELHEAGTCTGEPPAAVAVVSFDPATDMITVGTVAVELGERPDYHDERYWWDALGVDVEVLNEPDDVTIVFHRDTATAMVTCVAEDTAVACS